MTVVGQLALSNSSQMFADTRARLRCAWTPPPTFQTPISPTKFCRRWSLDRRPCSGRVRLRDVNQLEIQIPPARLPSAMRPGKQLVLPEQDSGSARKAHSDIQLRDSAWMSLEEETSGQRNETFI